MCQGSRHRELTLNRIKAQDIVDSEVENSVFRAARSETSTQPKWLRWSKSGLTTKSPKI